jgi:hypothetical protein
VGKDTLRYMGDFGFVMLSFSCLFIIQACEVFGSPLPDILKPLEIVEEVAQLMTELGINVHHGPRFYGRSILARLHSLSEAGIWPRTDNDVTRYGDVSIEEQYSFSTGLEDVDSTDPLWEFTNFFLDYPRV